MSVPARVCALVDKRDGEACVKCGTQLGDFSRHHRKLRSRGGRDTASNLVLVCGSGTTGCHGWAHANPAAATSLGLIVPSWSEPELVPVIRVAMRGWGLLDDEGGVQVLSRRGAEHRFADLGIPWQP